MLNRRTVSRYHLTHSLPGYIEHGETRYLGEIAEFSTAGFRLRLRNTSKEAFISTARTHDFGEIIYGQDEISGFGEIRYVRAEGSDLWIGFKWDDLHADEHIHKSFAIIGELAAKGKAGCVNVDSGVAELAGHVSSILSEDLLQCVTRGIYCISLQECTSIDESGLSMLAGLEGGKLQIIEASPEMAALLQQHHLQRQDSGAADFCGIAA